LLIGDHQLGDFMNFNAAEIVPLVAKYAIPVLGAFVVFIIGRAIAKRLGRATENLMNKRPDSEATLSRFAGSVVKFLILVFTIIASLTVIGIDTSSFSAIVLGLGAAMGFILQGSLSNVAAGVMLMLFRPFKIGDEIEAGGVAGKVTDISLTATRLTSADNREFIVSNGNVWGDTIVNNTSMSERRLDMQFSISYDADIDTAIAALTQTASAHPLVLASPEPWAKVVNLNESSVDLELRAWCKASDYKALKVSISQPVKAALDKAKIEIPYPREIKISKHVKNSKGRDRLARLKSLKNS